MNNQDTKPESDVPEELKEAKETKELQEEKAEMDIKAEIPKKDMILSAVGYVGFLCVLPLILRRDSEYCQHHAHQALILAIAVYFLDSLHILPASFVGIYLVVKYIIILFSIYEALRGKKHKLPFIYGLSQKFQVTIN
jgi:uncharacterized membrane protein